jgi:hypothetical protein
LLPIFLVTALILLVSEKGGRLGRKALMRLMCFALGTAIVGLVFLTKILPDVDYVHTADISGYEGLDLLTPTVSLLWEINYFCFWWTMFPPRLSDLAYMMVGGFPIFFIVALSIVKPIWSTRSLFSRELWIFFLAALITAYGYQIFLFLGWKLFNLPPSHFEEVRAVKYALFPCFIFVGFVAHFLLDRRRYLPLCVMVFFLILNPYRVSKIAPDVLKQQVFNNLAPYFSERSKLDYLEKALDLNNATNADKVQIFRILEQRA